LFYHSLGQDYVLTANLISWVNACDLAKKMKIYFLLNLNNTTDAIPQESLNICVVKKGNIIEINGVKWFIAGV
jgi:hypothetical protein